MHFFKYIFLLQKYCGGGGVEVSVCDVMCDVLMAENDAETQEAGDGCCHCTVPYLKASEKFIKIH